jgi:hypothetical protein
MTNMILTLSRVVISAIKVPKIEKVLSRIFADETVALHRIYIRSKDLKHKPVLHGHEV